MNTKNLFKIAIKALSTNKFRTFLTMLGIIIGVASVISMLAIGQGSKRSIQNEIGKMGSNLIFVMPGNESFRGAMISSSQIQSLTLDDCKAISDNAKYITAISPSVNAAGQVIYGSKNSPTTMQGGNLEVMGIRKYEIAKGSMFTEADLRTSAKVCVLGQTVVDNIFEKGDDPVGKMIRFNKIPFKVIGVLVEKGQSGMGQDQDDVIIAPYTTVQKRVLAITYINSILASAQSEDLSPKAQQEIRQILRTQHKLKETDDDNFTIRTQQELVSMISTTSKIMTILLAVISGISLLVGGIGIMNIMLVSVTERTREIGIRMAVGGREGDILFQFLIEACMISFSGGIIGILIGSGISFVIKNILNWPITISTFSILLGFVVCTIIGVFFGWYPARKASRLDPIDALRYE